MIALVVVMSVSSFGPQTCTDNAKCCNNDEVSITLTFTAAFSAQHLGKKKKYNNHLSASRSSSLSFLQAQTSASSIVLPPLRTHGQPENWVLLPTQLTRPIGDTICHSLPSSTPYCRALLPPPLHRTLSPSFSFPRITQPAATFRLARHLLGSARKRDGLAAVMKCGRMMTSSSQGMNSPLSLARTK